MERDEVITLHEELRLPREVCRLLARRGHRTPDSARRFLRPRFGHLHPPGLLPDLERAVERIEEALGSGERILVHGDYDADGMTAAALLTRGLETLGADVDAFVPHRTREGYDLGARGLEVADELGAGLIVTADCGVSAVDAVREAGAAGRDVVITDHHRPPARLPDAVAVVNPSREESRYPFAGLAGVGVAFKLLAALYGRAGRPGETLNQHLDLVAIGTVADMVPLVEENRIFARAGLRALRQTLKPGLRALLERAGLESGDLTAADVSFRVAPRLNSVGRVGEAATGLRLLLTENEETARRLAGRLEETNRERRRQDRAVQAEAEALLAERYDPAADRAVVLWDDGWHPGVIGVAASRLVEEIYRPVVLVSLDGEMGRGSGRSIDGFHLHRALEECAPLLERYGGHRMAAGLEIRRSQLPAFTQRLQEVARRELDAGDLEPELELDLDLPLERADGDFHRFLAHLGPFGAENPRPVLVSRGVAFEDPSAVGREGRHLKVGLRGASGGRLGSIGFGMGDRLEEARSEGRFDVAYELVEDRYRGRARLQARLRDFRVAHGG